MPNTKVSTSVQELPEKRKTTRGRKKQQDVDDSATNANSVFVKAKPEIMHLPIRLDKEALKTESLGKMTLLDSSDEVEPYDPGHVAQTVLFGKSSTYAEVNYPNQHVLMNETDDIQDKFTSVQSVEQVQPQTVQPSQVCSPQSGGFDTDVITYETDETYRIIWKQSKVHGLQKEWRKQAHYTPYPNRTSSVCHWCCHPLRSNVQPIGLPIHYIKGAFYVKGCFCCYNCAAAYALQSNNLETFATLESYALLHLLYRKLHPKMKQGQFHIQPSPAREWLQMFGGPLTIEEYHQTHTFQDRQFICHEPPLISIVPSLEETTVDRQDSKHVPFSSRFLPEANQKTAKPSIQPIWFGKNQVTTAQPEQSGTTVLNINGEDYRLRRSKPLHEVRTTLENYLQVTRAE